MHGQTARLQILMQRIEKNSELARLANEWDRNRDLMRAALGPLDDMKRFDLAEPTLLAATLRATLDRDLIDRFQLPATIEVAPLLRDFVASGSADILARFSATEAELQRTMEAMRTPWLDVRDSIPGRSAASQNCRKSAWSCSASPSFDPGFTDNLRTALGDWRAPVTLPASIFDDVVARTALYAERGLDRYLTAFPAAAFRESLSIAGLSEAPPALATPYFTDLMNRKSNEEIGFQRTNTAHDRLLQFETQIRRFIDERMKAAYGNRWVDRSLPGPIRQNWEDKKEKAQDSGQRTGP